MIDSAKLVFKMSHLAVSVLIYFISINLSYSAPVKTVLDEFITEMNLNKCLVPKEIKLPNATETQELTAFTTYLTSCSRPKEHLPKTSLKLCDEVFALLRSIACTQTPSTLPAISVELSTEVCADFNALADSMPDGLLKHLSDPFVCDIACSEDLNATCQLLLWSYQVDQRIKDAVSEQQSENDIPEKDIAVKPVNGEDDTMQQVVAQHEELPKQSELNQLEQQTTELQENIDQKLKENYKLSGLMPENFKNTADNPEDIQKNGSPSLVPQSGTELDKSTEKKSHQGEHLEEKTSIDANTQPIEGKITDQSDKVDTHSNKAEITVPDNNGKKLPVQNTVDSTQHVEESKPEDGASILGVKVIKPQTISSSTSVDKSATLTVQTNPQPINAKVKQQDVTDTHQKSTVKQTTISQTKTTVLKNVTLKNVPQKEADSKDQIPPVSEKGETISSLSTKTDTSVEVTKIDSAKEVPSSYSSPALENMEDGEIPLTRDKDPDQYTDLETDGEGDYDELKNKDSKPFSPKTQETNGNIDVRRDDISMMEQPPYRQAHDGIQVIAAFPEQEDTHFFFYFLSLVLMLMAGYLIFHNKQKIIALIVEGRHERGRRRSHGASYKKLDTK